MNLLEDHTNYKESAAPIRSRSSFQGTEWGVVHPKPAAHLLSLSHWHKTLNSVS
jgi:hypothetical protein